jgi:Cu+-exporting ATPase
VGIDADTWKDRANELRADGATAILVGIDKRLAGVIGISDPIRKTTPAALSELAQQGIKVVMMTGDNKVTADAVARKLGIDAVEADVLPGRKSEVVNRLRGQGGLSRWLGTASTTPRPLPRPMLALPWELAPMSPSKVPASLCSTAT